MDLMKQDPLQLKQCCANFYGSEAVRFLLGDSFHPGGIELTRELSGLLRLTPGSLVLDVACGKGTSAMFLAETTDCRVIGIDLSRENLDSAQAEAAKHGISERVEFRSADAEQLPFDAETFDAIVCECAFCTFPDKQRAAAEFARVLKLGGHVGISDLTRVRTPLSALDGLLAWIACIGDAQSLQEYAAWLTAAGLRLTFSEPRDQALVEVVRNIRTRLLMADVLRGLGKLPLEGFDLQEANQMAKAAADAIQSGQLGYGIVIAEKPEPISGARP